MNGIGQDAHLPDDALPAQAELDHGVEAMPAQAKLPASARKCPPVLASARLCSAIAADVWRFPTQRPKMVNCTSAELKASTRATEDCGSSALPLTTCGVKEKVAASAADLKARPRGKRGRTASFITSRRLRQRMTPTMVQPGSGSVVQLSTLPATLREPNTGGPP